MTVYILQGNTNIKFWGVIFLTSNYNLDNNEGEVSFEYMYQKYKNTVYVMIGKVIEDKDLKNDCMQEIFMKYFKSMDRVSGEEASKRWLMAIAHNTIIDMSKKDCVYKSRIKLICDENEVLSACSMLDNLPLDSVLKNELAEKVSLVIRDMKPIHKEIVRLRYYLELTPKEIARLLDIPLDTVYSRLRRSEKIIYGAICQYMKEKRQDG